VTHPCGQFLLLFVDTLSTLNRIIPNVLSDAMEENKENFPPSKKQRLSLSLKRKPSKGLQPPLVD
jgi:hypothetical protein